MIKNQLSNKIDKELITENLFAILDEAFVTHHGIFLDRATSLFETLETITAVVEHERNVLFARNLYPAEIAGALTRAMTDDGLIDAAAERNLELVRRVAGREEIRARVINFYEKLAGE